MKTKIQLFLAVALMPTVVLVGCKKEDDALLNGPEKTVLIKISAPEEPVTYKEDASQTAAAVGFSSGAIYFTNDGGTILNYKTIDEDADATVAQVTGASGHAFNVNPGVTKVYIVGNTTGLATSGNISAVKESLLAVASQGNVALLNLYGEATSLTPVDGEPTKFTAEVTLNPTLARLELAQLEGDGVITGFKVKGIFLDDFYKQAQVDGGGLASLKGKTTDPVHYVDDTTDYPTASKPAIYDWYGTALEADSKVAKPASSDVWAYNFFATADGSAVPRLIIRLEDITTSDSSTYPNPQFITVKGLFEQNTSNSIASVKAGHVYKIANIKFTPDKLSPQPNLSEIEVTVTVTLATWVIENVDADF